MSKKIPAAIIAFSLFSFFFFVLPNYDQIMQLREAIVLRNEILSDRQKLIEQIDSLNARYQGNLSNVAKIASIVPKDKKTAELTSMVDAIVQQSGAKLVGIKFAALGETEEIAYKRLLSEVRIAAAYPSIVNILELLEQSIRISDVTEMTVSQAEEGGILNVTIKFLSYYLGEEKKQTPAISPKEGGVL